MFAGVAGAADPDRPTAVGRVGVGHVVDLGGQLEPVQRLRRPRALDGQHAVVAVVVDHLDSGRRGGREPAHDLGRVGRIRNEEHLVRADEVGDEIVDHAAGVVTTQRVLGVARSDSAEVVGEALVHEVGRPGPAHPRLAEMGNVEEADGLANGGVLAQHTAPAGGVFDGHFPAAEVGELGSKGNMAVVQGRPRQIRHDPHATDCRSSGAWPS